ncbi:glycosyltransferase [Schleiferia thermophila str. Yellowstone]|jgi:glycosyltransferase involved in cell wall biosynthesis|uniref:Glycosyltransferase involved in cell wall biosynthesis n=1 Tax=Schleiferia thermophila TaxID=884107 RepID=A0A369A7H0_9FLAO|nr:glycosyltransferase [Schleiferia thermophila str. Yellowstone]PMB17258.1 glycosyltransferase family 1 protein [Fischerella thermalis CCMEE 5319]RCX05302.1 glycosyltransferase involved in cell wall biosynthesis [Schleiferia thermophila]GCD79190.1 hypothetical protein JCM30197_04370 [Schleiferia thermophila]
MFCNFIPYQWLKILKFVPKKTIAVRIAVNTRFLIPGRMEGIGWFTYHTLKIITQKHPEVEFIFLFDRPWDKGFVFGPNVHPVILRPPARHPVLWYLYFEYSIHEYLRRHRCDLFLSTDGFLSLRHKKTPQLAVIHDINFEHHPKFLPPLVRAYYRHFFPRYARHARRIATVSQWSANDLVKTYGVTSSKIDVVYNGASEIFAPISPAEKVSKRQMISDGKPYFIFVGAFNPRKNIEGLFRSFDLFADRIDRDFRLVIVGEKMHWTTSMQDSFRQMKHREKVIFAGRRQGRELNDILAASEGLWFVSNFEGFGIPIVEAFRAGVPVITSTVTSLPEVAGDAALLCNPADHYAIAEAMLRLARDSKLRNALIIKGMNRAKLFTWEDSAVRLWHSIEKTLL